MMPVKTNGLLRLKRLELQGFKSFCDRTELRFNGAGIVAIVGPNGCGKSNLSDAVSWVLGEQSAKSLRGTRMEDVIFAGTKDRKPVGMASVTLTLFSASVDQFPHAGSNGDGAANGDGKRLESAPGEIRITRRLFRSGESEYLINGRPARLRDIQELFLGTGLGPECYAIIEQGRIGQILSSRPQERRAVIEEAAGITKFKTKRRLAEAKLESARQNLTRVFDILEEVSRQMNSLKRQAAKARRYEELRSEMTVQLRRLLSGRYRLLEREAARIALDLNLANADFQRISAEVQQQEGQYDRLQVEGYEAEKELAEARRRLSELELDSERTRGRMESQGRQVVSIEERLSQAGHEAGELEQRVAELARERAEQGARARDLEQEAEALRVRLAEKGEERAKLQEAVRGCEGRIEASRQAALALMGEVSLLRNRLAQLEEYLAGLERDEARARKEEQTAQADWERLHQVKEATSQRLAARQATLESLADRRGRTEAALEEQRVVARQVRASVEAARAELAHIRARRDSLEEILSHRAYTTEAVKRLFGAIEAGRAGELRPLGVLADFVEVEPAYEKAVEEFLHEELEYVLVADWKQAERGIELLRKELEGRATFLVHASEETDGLRPDGRHLAEPAIGPESGITGRLRDVLRLTNGLTHAPAELVPRLARCFLVEDGVTAQRLAWQYPDLYFLLPDGLCYHGQALSGGKKTSSGPLALKRELRELRGLMARRDRELAENAAQLAALETGITELERTLEQLRIEHQGEEKESLALEHEMKRVAEELSRCGSRLSLARLELERIAAARQQAALQREQWLAEIEEKERARREQEEQGAGERRRLESLQADAVRVAEEHAALRAELAGIEERLRAGEAAGSRLEAELADAERRRADLAADMERVRTERARLLADNIELDRRLAELSVQMAEARAQVEQWLARENEIRTQLGATDERLRRLRAELQAAQEKRSEIEMELVRRRAELGFVEETCRKDLGVAIREFAASEETAPPGEELAEIEAGYQDLRARIEALGPVNAQALEEYEETRQRYEFLNTQRQDLLDSIRDTEKAIQEIDAETRRRFTEAFAGINAHFRETFRALFGGGTGEMRLTDEGNAAESGIDIVASPPGKRLQNVLLLSGGEKALAALALLMAVFKYQPSPFCILDEVDAPLDEPNIRRLMNLLREMSHQTQFVLITHAKRTMESAETLYGVTMEEPGVSKIVAVRLQPAPGEAAEALVGAPS